MEIHSHSESDSIVVLLCQS